MDLIRLVAIFQIVFTAGNLSLFIMVALTGGSLSPLSLLTFGVSWIVCLWSPVWEEIKTILKELKG